ncbi:hypothetical protein [Subdoligranulum variabile]|uniref:Uncharacterized protein n=1 Tax=Subdoligranulum variabile DSM 15176 TaxID=411471 RepID=D1PRE5_9FIRM|nr:hypothetical protein [Subdoligranulum variabile]EFB74671.1 hypothetical protein SUBVAR_06974 [Subdoligranulum variabile DSM 15176]UWP69423.1 hypothetical protein NQ490_06125 [Subdoligranulum variabile]
MSMIVLAIVLAITVEGVVEIGKSIGKAVLGGSYKTAITQVAALVFGCLFCVAAKADVYSALGITFEIQWLGMVLTGVLASRGSNYISDFIKRLQDVSGAVTGK